MPAGLAALCCRMARPSLPCNEAQIMLSTTEVRVCAIAAGDAVAGAGINTYTKPQVSMSSTWVAPQVSGVKQCLSCYVEMGWPVGNGMWDPSHAVGTLVFLCLKLSC